MATRRSGGDRARADDPTSSASDDDEALLVRARRDPEAFGVFYDRRHGAVLRYFAYHTGARHLAAELTAETFAQALAGIGRFDPRRGSATGWLFGIAAHQFHRFLRSGEVDQRHRRRLGVITPGFAVDHADRAIDVADAQRLRPQLTSALADLSDPLRAAVLLRIVGDLPYAEVAERLGCTEGTARIRVSRGLQQLTASMVTP